MTPNFAVFTASAPYFTQKNIYIEKEMKSYWRQTSALFDVMIWCEDIRISFLTGISETLLDTSQESNKIPYRNVTMSDI
jgi:hypothetical protein